MIADPFKNVAPEVVRAIPDFALAAESDINLDLKAYLRGGEAEAENNPTFTQDVAPLGSLDLSSGVLSGPVGVVPGSNSFTLGCNNDLGPAVTDTFNLDVTATASTQLVTLSWVAPTTFTDAAPITDPISYLLEWGTTTGVYTDSQTFPAGSLGGTLELALATTFFLRLTAIVNGNLGTPTAEVTYSTP